MSAVDPSPRLWWVNQSQEFTAESQGGFVFAAPTVKGGGAPAYRRRINDLRPGDIMLHYANGALRAIGLVDAKAIDESRPGKPSVRGRMAKVTYFPLSSPVTLSEIDEAVRLAENVDGPFDKDLEVKEGYLWEPSAALGRYVAQAFKDRIPDGAPSLDLHGRESPWEEYVRWGRRFYEDAEFDSEERQYKKTVAEHLATAIATFRDDALADQVDAEGQLAWLRDLKRAFGPPNNMTAWQGHDRFLKWCQANPELARAAIGAIWAIKEPLTGITAFLDVVPVGDVPGRAQRLAIAALLLFGTDPDNYPPYRNSALATGLRLTRQPPIRTDETYAQLYDRFLKFLDDLASVALQQGFTVPSRIDAQGVAWCLHAYPPRESWPPADQRAFLKFRGDKVDSDLGRFVELFREESGYPNDKDKKRLADRSELAEDLAADALTEPDLESLRRLVGPAFASPGVMPQLSKTLSSEGGPEKFAAALSHVLYGDGPMEKRLDDVISGAFTLPGLGGAVPTKALSVVFPNEWLPVAGYGGKRGKRVLMDLIGLPPLDPQLSRGVKIVQSNEALSRALEPHFGQDSFGMSRFLFWLQERDGPRPGGTMDELAKSLYLPPGFLEEIVTLLQSKKQVIFYGPPGTGKTFVARALAGVLAAEASRAIVQFHPSYAYEDFVEGYRPSLEDGVASFSLVDGPLKKIAEAAELTDTTHILIIDEINRGNIAKVFGELYFLLEYRDEPMHLQYSLDTTFSMPENLWIIGTMNTADRSIALVDAALRRRFYFVGFFPNAEPVRSVLGAWLAENHADLAWLDDVVERANAKLDDPDRAIGPSYFMTKDLDEAWIERIWRHSVLPYIAEQYVGNEDKVAEFELKRLRAGIEDLAGHVAEEPPQEAADDGAD